MFPLTSATISRIYLVRLSPATSMVESIFRSLLPGRSRKIKHHVQINEQNHPTEVRNRDVRQNGNECQHSMHRLEIASKEHRIFEIKTTRVDGSRSRYNEGLPVKRAVEKRANEISSEWYASKVHQMIDFFPPFSLCI